MMSTASRAAPAGGLKTANQGGAEPLDALPQTTVALEELTLRVVVPACETRQIKDPSFGRFKGMGTADLNSLPSWTASAVQTAISPAERRISWARPDRHTGRRTQRCTLCRQEHSRGARCAPAKAGSPATSTTPASVPLPNWPYISPLAKGTSTTMAQSQLARARRPRSSLRWLEVGTPRNREELRSVRGAGPSAAAPFTVTEHDEICSVAHHV